MKKLPIFKVSVFPSILGLLLASSTATAEPGLPIPDGRYTTDYRLCMPTDQSHIDMLGDLVGAYVRNIAGHYITNDYEMECEIQKVTTKENVSNFTADCQAEGDIERVHGRYTRIDDQSFRLGDRIFRLCSSSNNTPTDNVYQLTLSAQQLIRAERKHNSFCRGGGLPGDEITKACGIRDEYGSLLLKLGWCFGKKGQAGYQMQWHVCESKSSR